MFWCILGVIYSFVVCWCNAENGHNVTYQYHVSTDEQNWIQSFINCKNAGMDLVSIPTKTDQENLEKFMKDAGYNEGYWTSGTNLGNGNYYWASTGNTVVYTKWLPGQPNDAKLIENKHRGENCIQWGLYKESPDPIGWSDLMCGFKLRYICQETEICDNKII